MLEVWENHIAVLLYDINLPIIVDQQIDEIILEQQPDFVENINAEGDHVEQSNNQNAEEVLGKVIPSQPHIIEELSNNKNSEEVPVIPTRPHFTINCVNMMNQNGFNQFLKLYLRNGFCNTCGIKYPEESCRWVLYFASGDITADVLHLLKTRILNQIGGIEVIDSSLQAIDFTGQIRSMIVIRNINCNGHPIDFWSKYQWVRPVMRQKYDVIILNDKSGKEKVLRVRNLEIIIPKMLKFGFKLVPVCNENDSRIIDGNEFTCITNGEDCTSTTSSSQCNTNSKISRCRNVENHRESITKLQTTSPRCSEFRNVISPEITTNSRATEEMNGASNENEVTQMLSSADTKDPSSSNTDCNIERLSDNTSEISYISYESENQMPDIMKLIQKDLSEPYSIYTYRYFIHNWPHLCFLAVSKGKSVGAIVCKLDLHRKIIKRGYIAMLAVDECFRKKGIGSNLVLKAIGHMATEGADEVVLETEITNQPALRLYENLGFVRDKRLFRYYLNGVDALRLKLWLK